MRTSRVVVVIDRLSLHRNEPGATLGPSQRRALAEALEAALAQHIAAGRGAYRSAAVDGYVASPLRMDAWATPRSLGAALATRIWDGLAQTQPQLQRDARSPQRARRAAYRSS
ncbi:hypothetical protein [Paraburkholderia sp. 35.1]|uniref:hypothetical protein n=1 Tax=Paraburkholderia sp. 35.1 TaxID=2991058 RepID=UPI003D2262B8